MMKTRQVFSVSAVFMGILLIVFALSLSIVQGAASASTDIPEEQDQDLRTGVFTTCENVTDITYPECLAIVSLYDNTAGEGWTNHNFWKISNTVCNWYGVTCESGHVAFLDLHNNNLVGPLPTELGSLFSLHELELRGNSLNGSIPSSLGGLTGLTLLSLSYNQLTGEIPTQLGSMASLRYLLLDNNQLTGSIPTSLGNLASLVYLNLGHNQLSGGIPGQLGLLTNLETLVLNSNPLGGGLPGEMSALTKLRQLSLREDQLTGSIPAWLGNLTNLLLVELNFNQFSGVIPPEIGNLPELWVLYLHGNNLSGEIPSSMGNLGDLVHLYLSQNQISGSIPPELGSLSKLTDLGLSDNLLTGGIPPSLGNLAKLQNLYLYNNQLSGSLPPELGNLSELIGLYLNDNGLSGKLPSEIGNLNLLQELLLYSNDFSGMIPVSYTSLSNVSNLQYQDTRLCASIDTSFRDWIESIEYVSGTWDCLAAPVKTSPVSNAFTRDTTPKFSWQSQMDGEKYQVKVDNDADFTSPVFNVSGLINPYKTFTTTLVQGAYYWKVRAQDPGGNWSPWSTKWKFTVDTTKPGKPILLTPANGSKTGDRTPTFTWKVVTGAKYYQLIVDDNADFSSPVFTSAWMTVTSKAFGTPLAPKLYYWRVRAKDAAGNIGAWSLA